jgi:hypothetical protein
MALASGADREEMADGLATATKEEPERFTKL